MRFTDTKSETLNLRVSPVFKLALKEAADREHRSMVNMLEVLLCEYCERKGIVQIDQKTASSPGKSRSRAHRSTHSGVST